MLRRLTIDNFALISHLDISLRQGLTLITGETGAGKSILLGALGLILGDRADLSSAMDPSKKCVIEGEFELTGLAKALNPYFEEWELDFYSECLIRREISPSGRSRAFINDTPVGINQLKTLGSFLIDIHSQHDTTALFTPEFQMNLLDYFSGNESLLSNYKLVYTAYKTNQKKLQDLQNQKDELEKDHEYHSHLLDEFEGINLEIDEDELKSRVELFEHLESTVSSLNTVLALIREGEINGISLLQQSISEIRTIKQEHVTIAQIRERLEGLNIELNDVMDDMESFVSGLDSNPEEQALLTQTFNTIELLKSKHKVENLAGLMETKENLIDKIQGMFTADHEIKKMEEAIHEQEQELESLAVQLHERRALEGLNLAIEVNQKLDFLGMENAELTVDLRLKEKFNSFGKDAIQLLFRANKGGELKPIEKTASGGELSRLMLVIKSIMAQFSALPTLIFDEIDTGVSGEIAHKMGKVMHELSKSHQLIAITHLPQIASKPGQHLKVQKRDIDNITHSEVVVLNEEDRVQEISKMLSGVNASAAAIENAKELLAHP